MSAKLYVGNLALDTTEDNLADVFRQDSRQVRKVSIITDAGTGRSHGFAFVTMATEADAQAAMKALDGTALDGRTLRVNEAHDKRSGGSGARGGERPNAF